MKVEIAGALLLAAGLLLAIFADRLLKWWNHIAWNLFRVGPSASINASQKKLTEEQFYNSSPLKRFWNFWIWWARAMGALVAAVGIIFLSR